MKHQSSRPSGSGSGSGRPAHNFGGRNAGHKPKGDSKGGHSKGPASGGHSKGGPSKGPAKSGFPGARSDESKSFGSKSFDRGPRSDESKSFGSKSFDRGPRSDESKSFGSKSFDRGPRRDEAKSFDRGSRRDEPMSRDARQEGYDNYEPRKIALPSREGSTGVRLNRHSALIGRGLEKDESFLDELFTEDRTFLFLILDGVQDPHNLGACMRSADGAGVDAVIIPRDRAAPITEIVHQVSCGATESVPVIRVTNLTRTIEKLKKHGVWTVGTSDRAEQLIYDVDLTGSMALVMGGEGPGMRRLTTENCDFLTKLPMAGKVECLNVSVATGVCLYEIVRQRLGKKA